MSLGVFKRVALWLDRRKHLELARKANVLMETDVSDAFLPLNVATFWRDTTPSVFTTVPVQVQICEPLVRQHESLSQLADLLDKTIKLIVNDDFEHLTQYLSRKLEKRYSNSVAEYLTDNRGYPIDTVEVYQRINTMLYSLAAALDGLESFEYHRAVNPLYRELVNVIARLLEIKHR